MFSGLTPFLAVVCAMGLLSSSLCHLFRILLLALKKSVIGCYWGLEFVETLDYDDDVVLLAPSLSAIRLMLWT